LALLAGLRTQAVRKIAHLFQMPASTNFAFFENNNLLETWGGPEFTSLDPLPLIWGAVRTRAEEMPIDPTLARMGSVPLRLHPDGDVTRFGFGTSEISLIDLMRARPSSVEALIASKISPERAAKLLLYTLLITRHVGNGSNESPPVGLQQVTESYRARKS